MTPREIAAKAVMITTLAGAMLAAVHVLGWIAETDAKVEQGMLEAYCTGVATWKVEEARGVLLEHRTGHPDYDEIAAERCPGLWPAGRATNQRQLAQE
ncbi:hypothetical protein [Halomonas sp.]|uniref:hypothetical protein n=1 Tax=Halomonas sp. TaxID=1486246 RepID=UPI003D1141C6